MLPKKRSKSRRHDADNGGNDALDGDGFPQHLRIAVVLLLPERGADHNCLYQVLGFFRGVHPAEDRFGSQQVEKVWRGIYRLQWTRLANTADDGDIVVADQSDVGKNAILLIPIQILGYGRALSRLRMSLFELPNDHQAVRIGKWHGAIQQGVQYAEDGAVGCDTDGQGQDHNHEEPRIFQQTAGPQPHIRPEILSHLTYSHCHTSPADRARLTVKRESRTFVS